MTIHERRGNVDQITGLLGRIEEVRPGFILAVLRHFRQDHQGEGSDPQKTIDHIEAFLRGELTLEPIPEDDPDYSSDRPIRLVAAKEKG